MNKIVGLIVYLLVLFYGGIACLGFFAEEKVVPFRVSVFHLITAVILFFVMMYLMISKEKP